MTPSPPPASAPLDTHAASIGDMSGELCCRCVLCMVPNDIFAAILATYCPVQVLPRIWAAFGSSRKHRDAACEVLLKTAANSQRGADSVRPAHLVPEHAPFYKAVCHMLRVPVGMDGDTGTSDPSHLSPHSSGSLAAAATNAFTDSVADEQSRLRHQTRMISAMTKHVLYMRYIRRTRLHTSHNHQALVPVRAHENGNGSPPTSPRQSRALGSAVESAVGCGSLWLDSSIIGADQPTAQRAQRPTPEHHQGNCIRVIVSVAVSEQWTSHKDGHRAIRCALERTMELWNAAFQHLSPQFAPSSSFHPSSSSSPFLSAPRSTTVRWSMKPSTIVPMPPYGRLRGCNPNDRATLRSLAATMEASNQILTISQAPTQSHLHAHISTQPSRSVCAALDLDMGSMSLSKQRRRQQQMGQHETKASRKHATARVPQFPMQAMHILTPDQARRRWDDAFASPRVASDGSTYRIQNSWLISDPAFSCDDGLIICWAYKESALSTATSTTTTSQTGGPAIDALLRSMLRHRDES